MTTITNNIWWRFPNKILHPVDPNIVFGKDAFSRTNSKEMDFLRQMPGRCKGISARIKNYEKYKA